MIPVDYSRPLEAVIPGTAGKVLGVLARTHAELPIRRVAQLAGVSRDRASIEIRRLVALGIVSRREVAGASLVKIERTNAAASALLALADARATAISRLSELAKSIKPAPASLVLFGSFARGTDDAESDLDVLAVRSDDVEPDDPSWLDSFGNWQDLARVAVGNPVNVIETSRHELPALARTRSLWRTIVDEAITLAGEEPWRIVAPVRVRATIVSQAVESSSAHRLSGRKPGVHTAKPIARAATARVVRAEASERTAAVPNVRTAAMPVVRRAAASAPKRTKGAR
jgi:predicted nucleotidyltransferase